MLLGQRAAASAMVGQDKVWARHSNDKVDIGESLTRIIRTLNRALPLEAPMRALSVGNSSEFGRELQRAGGPGGDEAQVVLKRSRVEFFVEDFERLMAVVWMILLHPRVHRFNTEQQCDVIECVYLDLWRRRKPLVQEQDHLAIYRGNGVRGLV
jgi:hypothetical protein